MPGRFIVLEGPDGSGTTLHSHLLANRLREAGFDVLETAEPSLGPIGQQIRGILKGHEKIADDALQLLFCADRAQHLADIIEPALREGKTVICDRYALSTIVYGAASGLDRQWLKQVNAAFREPDITILTLPPIEVCMERLHRRSELDALEASELFQRRVYEEYATTRDPNIVLVDTSGNARHVAEFLWNQLKMNFSNLPVDERVME